MNQDLQNDIIAIILTKCREDESFKQQLLNDPAATLKTEGVEIPFGYTVRIMENTEDTFHFVIPNRSTDLPDDLLERLAGGTNSKEVVVRNDFIKGAINACIYKDGKLL